MDGFAGYTDILDHYHGRLHRRYLVFATGEEGNSESQLMGSHAALPRILDLCTYYGPCRAEPADEPVAGQQLREYHQVYQSRAVRFATILASSGRRPGRRTQR